MRLSRLAVTSVIGTEALLLPLAGAAATPPQARAPHVRELWDLTASSATDVWAFGGQRTGESSYEPVTRHWDGSSWTTVPTGVADGFLLSAVELAPDDIWAGGYYGAQANTLLLHWDGTAWSRVELSTPVGSVIGHLSALDPDDVLAGGYSPDGESAKPLTLHYDGDAWSTVTRGPLAGLYLESGISPRDAWAVATNSRQATIFKHWDGTGWTRVRGPDLHGDGASLDAISAVSSDDVWVSGSTVVRGRDIGSCLMLHWNGAAWSRARVPGCSSVSSLNDVSFDAADDGWAVGVDLLHSRSLLRHWDGASWSTFDDPAHRLQESHLRAVVALSPSAAWAAGSFSADYGDLVDKLLMSWDGTVWTPTHRP